MFEQEFHKIITRILNRMTNNCISKAYDKWTMDCNPYLVYNTKKIKTCSDLFFTLLKKVISKQFSYIFVTKCLQKGKKLHNLRHYNFNSERVAQFLKNVMLKHKLKYYLAVH